MSHGERSRGGAEVRRRAAMRTVPGLPPGFSPADVVHDGFLAGAFHPDGTVSDTFLEDVGFEEAVRAPAVSRLVDEAFRDAPNRDEFVVRFIIALKSAPATDDVAQFREDVRDIARSFGLSYLVGLGLIALHLWNTCRAPSTP